MILTQADLDMILTQADIDMILTDADILDLTTDIQTWPYYRPHYRHPNMTLLQTSL